MRFPPTRILFAALLALFLATGSAHAQSPLQPDPPQITAAEHSITDSALRGHIRFLADDLLEGRGPGSRGDELAQHYIAAQFESLGLKPAAPGGGWFQPDPHVATPYYVIEVLPDQAAR